MALRSRIGWWLAAWFPGRWIRLGYSRYKVEREDLVRRGRFKDGR